MPQGTAASKHGSSRFPKTYAGKISDFQFAAFALADHGKVEHLLQVCRMAEVRAELHATCHGLGKTLIISGNRRYLDRLPVRSFHVLTKAAIQFGTAWTVDDLEAALLAVDAQPQLIQVSGCPAARVDDTERAIGEIDRHGEAVIGIQHI